MVVVPATAALEELLPPISCGAGWQIEGKPLLYERETLSDRINGEAELYFPYGFDQLAAARYTATIRPGAGLDVEIYRMGSLLDAFGMYANYRQREGLTVPAGTESNLSGTQLFLYRGRYFIHLQMTGTSGEAAAVLTECALNVVSRLPGDNSRPTELAVFARQEVVKGTERYLPQSLLGYDFFPRGIIADAALEGMPLQIFYLLGTTPSSAVTAFDSYRAQLSAVKIVTAKNSATYLEGVDPLYGPVMMLKKNSCLAGAIRFSGTKPVRSFLESICR